ncbi:MAG: hypothetical protein K2K20_06645 [Lachnospiraceae bacterium]|nr:hypothetical protein [Lachnospiraceae bacterium]
MENSYQISHEESSASDDASQTDDEENLSCLRYDGLYCYLDDLTEVSYECIDDKISFTTVDQNGTVDHCGTVQQDQLILDIHSNINGYEESNREYVFYPFEDIPGWYN